MATLNYSLVNLLGEQWTFIVVKLVYEINQNMQETITPLAT